MSESLVIRKSNFVGICLLALAVAIALTEYATYSPPIISTSPMAFQEKSEEFGEFIEPPDDVVPEEALDLEAAQETGRAESGVAEKDELEASRARQPFSTSDEENVTVHSGDTLASILEKLEFNRTEIHLASNALSKVFNLKNLRVGQEIEVRGKRDESGKLTLDGFTFRPDFECKVNVTRSGSKYTASRVKLPLRKVAKNISGTMLPRSPETSLRKCGMRPQAAREALYALRQVVDLRSSRRPVDFECLCHDFYDENGDSLRRSEFVYVSANVNGRIYRVYKFAGAGHREYIDANGLVVSCRAKSGSALGRPIGSAKITSGFGMRIHPISGRLRRHTGVDFSAHVGTPVLAAAAGTVARAGYYSGYGKYICIGHNGGICTAYGHLSKIIVKIGQSVQQGQVIGYTGNTGYSHGPHLHYEVLENGRFINPLTRIKQPPPRLTGTKLCKFNQFKKEVNLQVASIASISKSADKSRRCLS